MHPAQFHGILKVLIFFLILEALFDKKTIIKGQIISEAIFLVLNSSKKRTRVEVFRSFLEVLKTGKKSDEIN